MASSRWYCYENGEKSITKLKLIKAWNYKKNIFKVQLFWVRDIKKVTGESFINNYFSVHGNFSISLSLLFCVLKVVIYFHNNNKNNQMR